jgi:hypothetical protein
LDTHPIMYLWTQLNFIVLTGFGVSGSVQLEILTTFNIWQLWSWTLRVDICNLSILKEYEWDEDSSSLRSILFLKFQEVV